MGPHLVAEAKRRPAGEVRLGSVSPQQGGDVPGGEGHLGEGWGERHTLGHVSRLCRAPG